jgi:hypothetical protein
VFFFEKKNQKIFATWFLRCRPLWDQFAKVFALTKWLVEKALKRALLLAASELPLCFHGGHTGHLFATPDPDILVTSV